MLLDYFRLRQGFFFFLVSQNLFYGTKEYRTISLNTQYVYIFIFFSFIYIYFFEVISIQNLFILSF